MERMQIYLDSVMRRQLNRMAVVLGLSKSELIREGLRLLLAQRSAPGQDPLLQLRAYAGRSGKTNISEAHDEYLAEKRKKRAA
ncbi:MAG: ribbon-helix-helix protein, CopG family [Elusimicrobia bacterium]|nr:ribbon-helix-helix protein, CopG family [Elusimicrobiota bacterium]